MALVNALKLDSNPTVTVKAHELVAILPVTPEMVSHKDCKGCPTGKAVKDYKAFAAEATPKIANVSVICTQPAQGVAIQIEPRTGEVNAVICTAVPLPPVGGIDGQSPNGSHHGHIGDGDLPKEALSGFTILLGVLLLLALGSTLWFHRKYQQELNANRTAREATKSKAQ